MKVILMLFFGSELFMILKYKPLNHHLPVTGWLCRQSKILAVLEKSPLSDIDVVQMITCYAGIALDLRSINLHSYP